MRPPKAVQRRRVQVLIGVGVLVMRPVMSGPPQYTLLRRTLSHEGQNELEHPAGLERAVREVAMIACGHKEHSDVVHG